MNRKCLILGFAGLAGLATVGFVRWPHQGALVVHERGTFTSLQGSDGVPLKWNPLESSRLPGFVYSWQHAGLGRYPSGMLGLGLKSALVTLQRMETPVIYFYADKEQTVDLAVRFPKGGITEWYPQAPQVGPSFVPPGPMITKLDSGLHHCGVSPSFTLASVFDHRDIKDSIIHWSDLNVVPAAPDTAAGQLLPADNSGSHYFAARQTDSAYVQVPSFSSINSRPECEKFLFYRGVGNFPAPLNVQMHSDGTMTLANRGKDLLGHLYILGIKEKAGTLQYLEELKPGERRNLVFDLNTHTLPVASLQRQIGEKMERALTAAGLYPREATAMVNTWSDSWFAEDGGRVLYILPRTWTDETLPMTLNPKPRELVRVMVGRAELITPQLEQKRNLDIARAQQGEAMAQQEIRSLARKLGRFAESIFAQAMDRAEILPADREKLDRLLCETRSGAQ
jgi:hypothetical protein